MVTDQQVRRLFQMLQRSEKMPLTRAALKSGMDEKTARKYRALAKLLLDQAEIVSTCLIKYCCIGMAE